MVGKEATMSGDAEQKPFAQKSYTMGNVGAGANVQQGEHLTMTVTALGGLPSGDALQQQFAVLLRRLQEQPGLDSDDRELSVAKAAAVADGLVQADKEPGKLRQALRDAKAWFGSTAGWAWEELSGILKGEAAQKTIGTIAEATTKAAIQALIGVG
jgi:hypothetical protein